METFHLEEYLSNGVDRIVKGIVKASFTNPKASFYMMQYARTNRQARRKREEAERRGEQIPPFLIASITDQCNLHCKGCYARANHSCTDLCRNHSVTELLSDGEWEDLFSQAAALGVGFILLAGGEPFVRREVLLAAGRQSEILFPVFTNGTMIDDSYMDLLEQHRNLLPVISIEGNRETTDARRGAGVYDRLQKTMEDLHRQGILFGASVTVNQKNMQEVLSDTFVESLREKGTKAVIYVEYVPVDESSRELAIDDPMREQMLARLNQLRGQEKEVIFVAFPGDEKSSGGCLAAGRGFFHINARGAAEPCPFSPYSDTSLRQVSLREALQSPLFQKLRQNGTLTEEHIGGCVLFEQREQIETLLEEA